MCRCVICTRLKRPGSPLIPTEDARARRLPHQSLRFACFFFVAAYLFGTLLSLAAILMEEVSFRRDRRPMGMLRLVFFAFIEPFGDHHHRMVPTQGVRTLLQGRSFLGPDEARGIWPGAGGRRRNAPRRVTAGPAPTYAVVA